MFLFQRKFEYFISFCLVTALLLALFLPLTISSSDFGEFKKSPQNEYKQIILKPNQTLTFYFVSPLTEFNQFSFLCNSPKSDKKLDIFWKLEQANLSNNKFTFNPMLNYYGDISLKSESNFLKKIYIFQNTGNPKFSLYRFNFPVVHNSFSKFFRFTIRNNVKKILNKKQLSIIFPISFNYSKKLSFLKLNNKKISGSLHCWLERTNYPYLFSNFGNKMLFVFNKLNVNHELFEKILQKSIYFFQHSYLILLIFVIAILYQISRNYLHLNAVTQLSSKGESFEFLTKNQNSSVFFFFFFLLLIVLISGILRWNDISTFKMNFDENFTQVNIGKSETDFFKMLLKDKHPPFYYILLKNWVKVFGSNIIKIRSFSVLWGILSIFLIGIFTWQIIDKKTALLAAFFLAIQPFQVTYSQIGRMYSLLAFMTLLSLILTNYNLKNLRNWKLTLYWIINILLLYTHYFAVFTVFFECVFYLVKKPEKRSRSFWLYFFGSQFVVLLLWIIPQLQFIEQSAVPHLNSFSTDSLNEFFWFSLPFKFMVGYWSIIFASIMLFFFLIGLIGKKLNALWKWYGLIYSTVILSLVWFVTRFIPIYQMKNLLILMPIFSIILAVGITTFFKEYKIIFVIFIVLLTLNLGRSIVFNRITAHSINTMRVPVETNLLKQVWRNEAKQTVLHRKKTAKDAF